MAPALLLLREQLAFSVLFCQLLLLVHDALHQLSFRLHLGVPESPLGFFPFPYFPLSLLSFPLLFFFEFLNLSFQFFRPCYFFLALIFVSLAL